jgi:hypothetical protein
MWFSKLVQYVVVTACNQTLLTERLRRKKNTCGSGSRPTLFFPADPIIFSTQLTVRPYFLQVVAGCSYSVPKWRLLSH